MTSFPGIVGIDIAKDIDRHLSFLQGCNRLIVDLRGNSGGGIGGLRLMSSLAPGKIEVGYIVSKRRARSGYRKEEFPRFQRIPAQKIVLPWLLARYSFADKSIVVVTEGLGRRQFHGRVVLLVNEHTASAGEMITMFAKENSLATIVGTKTAGRLLSSGSFRVGRGYRLVLPVAAYFTWRGTMVENNGIIPDVPVALSREGLKSNTDSQLEKALEVVCAL
jgi:C-terminal processing protease CtpA/Prc